MGKNLGDDLAEGKMTLPLIHAMAQSDADTRDALRHIVAHGDLDGLPAAQAAITACGSSVSYTHLDVYKRQDLPRVSRSMADQGTIVASREALAEGDLVFFGRRGHVDHVGIYIGNGQFLHAPRTGRDVTVSSLTTGYWAQKYLEARRLATGLSLIHI